MYNFNTKCKVWYELLQWALRKCLNVTTAFSNKSDAAEAVCRYILNNSHNDPRPQQVKPYHKPTVTANQTIRLPSHRFTSPKSHGVQAGYTAEWSERWHDRELSLKVMQQCWLRALPFGFAILHEPSCFVAMKIRGQKKTHFTVVYIFCLLFVVFVKYIHRTRQMASIMRKILLVQSVTERKSCSTIDEIFVLLIKQMHQLTVTFKLREAFITLCNGSQSRVRFQIDLHSSPSPANNKPSTQFVTLWVFSCIIVYPEIRNCLSTPTLYTHS